MKYFVIEIATGDTKIAGKGIYEFATRKEAVASFHSKLGVAMKSDLYESDLIMVINETGAQEMVELYIAKEPEVEEIGV